MTERPDLDRLDELERWVSIPPWGIETGYDTEEYELEDGRCVHESFPYIALLGSMRGSPGTHEIGRIHADGDAEFIVALRNAARWLIDRARLVDQIEQGKQRERLDDSAQLERLATDVLVALARAGIATPERGYLHEPHLVQTDIAKLAKERDDARREAKNSRAWGHSENIRYRLLRDAIEAHLFVPPDYDPDYDQCLIRAVADAAESIRRLNEKRRIEHRTLTSVLLMLASSALKSLERGKKHPLGDACIVCGARAGATVQHDEDCVIGNTLGMLGDPAQDDEFVRAIQDLVTAAHLVTRETWFQIRSEGEAKLLLDALEAVRKLGLAPNVPAEGNASDEHAS